MKRKAISILLAAALTCGFMAGAGSASQAAGRGAEEAAESPVQTFVEMTAEELTADMGAGWNLGNTMDGHTGFTPNEIQWQNVKTTKKLIRSVHDLGFNTVRIPVTWGTMIDDTAGKRHDCVRAKSGNYEVKPDFCKYCAKNRFQ